MGLLVVILVAVLLAGGAPGVSAVSVTVPYSATAVADADLDGNPATGSWSDALSAVVPLENGAASPYGSATLYAKHDGASVYFRIDGKIDVTWASATGNHFWLGMVYGSISGGTGHHRSGYDGVFFGMWNGAAYTPQPTPTTLNPVDTNGGAKPPAKDTSQNDLGKMAYSGTGAPYSFTAEWTRKLNTGDASDVVLLADGASSYYFYATTDSNGGGSSGGSIDHSKITNDNTMTFAAPPAPTTHDVAVTAASASPTSVLQGQAVTVSATVQNQGTVAETFAVSAHAGTILVATQTVSNLAAGASQSLSFAWDTTGVAPGSYPIRVEAAAVAGETNLANNAFDDATVVLIAPVHDVAVTSVSVSPTAGVIGDIFVVTVTAANQGTQAETFDVTALANGSAIGTKTVTLAAGATTTLTFSWSTAGLSAGSYAISATASAVPGETDLSDNTFSDGTVSLSAPPPVTPLLGLNRIWPEWRHGYSGTAQVFYAKVSNLGSVGAYAQVVYDIYDKATGAKVDTVSSQVVWIPAGAVVDRVAFASDPWTGAPGVYTVVGTLYYGIDPTNLSIMDGSKQISRFAIV